VTTIQYTVQYIDPGSDLVPENRTMNRGILCPYLESSVLITI
jgi:hypothetical protein